MKSGRSRVLIVDDSAMMREILRGILESDPDLEVIGAASEPAVAWRRIQNERPDVVTLDVEMPRMDGLTFLEKLMRAQPMPVVMVSSLTERGSATTLRALELGAVDFVEKPRLDVKAGTLQLASEIVAKVKAAARARVRPPRPPAAQAASPAKEPSRALHRSTHAVVALGASTGGTEALREVLTALPPDTPGIVVVQHMPERFTTSFAQRLDSLCRLRVSEAKHGDAVLPGHALIAPGGRHLRVVRSGGTYRVAVGDEEPVNRHRPSVDVLFDSVAREAGANAIGAILTGMGDDGARGLLEMHRAGAHTAAQDEASCVIFGMPKAAIARGGVDEILPLHEVAPAICRWAVRHRSGPS